MIQMYVTLFVLVYVYADMFSLCVYVHVRLFAYVHACALSLSLCIYRVNRLTAVETDIKFVHV